MPFDTSQFLLAFVIPGVAAAIAGALWRWPPREEPGLGSFLTGLVLAGGFVFGCWALGRLEWMPEPFGSGWVPYAAVSAVLVSGFNVLLGGVAGRVLQALLTLAFVVAAAWLMVRDSASQADFRWWAVGALAGAMALTWWTGEFAWRRQNGRFPVLLSPILLGMIAVVTMFNLASTSSLEMCSVAVAVMTGGALFAGANQKSVAKPAMAIFSVAYCGLLYAAYAGLTNAYKSEYVYRNLATLLAAVSPWLILLYGFWRDEEKRLPWKRGLLLTAVIITPALAGMGLSFLG
ncbi:MAG: hypothetical protein MPJ50_03225 [Pirellulales bacterium]|nr:hypothetical protein [Pirellulales bacterium]